MKLIPVIRPDEIEEDNLLPSRNHSALAHRLSVLLDRSCGDRFTVHQALSLKLDGWDTIPDVCQYPSGVLPHGWLDDDLEVTTPPALVIEILSARQNLQPLVDKARDYLKHGVGACWIVLPAAGGSHTVGGGSVRDDATGIEVSLDELFR